MIPDTQNKTDQADKTQCTICGGHYKNVPIHTGKAHNFRAKSLAHNPDGTFAPANTNRKTLKDILDPRQQLFIFNYFNPESSTFSNAYESALIAGYDESYANNILTESPKWLREYLGKHDELVRIAERNVREFVENKDKDITKFILTNNKKAKKNWNDDKKDTAINIILGVDYVKPDRKQATVIEPEQLESGQE